VGAVKVFKDVGFDRAGGRLIVKDGRHLVRVRQARAVIDAVLGSSCQIVIVSP
jgi:hypothetical protein